MITLGITQSSLYKVIPKTPLRYILNPGRAQTKGWDINDAGDAKHAIREDNPSQGSAGFFFDGEFRTWSLVEQRAKLNAAIERYISSRPLQRAIAWTGKAA
jgi:hypothetical protein